MKKPTKKQMLDLLKKIAYKFNEHQHEEGKILKGYTLAANIDGLTELSTEITNITAKY